MTTRSGLRQHLEQGVIQPLYFLSGAIFPLQGHRRWRGLLDIPQSLRAEAQPLRDLRDRRGRVVELPTWLKVLVYANPVSYMLDLLRLVTLGFSQLPLAPISLRPSPFRCCRRACGHAMASLEARSDHAPAYGYCSGKEIGQPTDGPLRDLARCGTEGMRNTL